MDLQKLENYRLSMHSGYIHSASVKLRDRDATLIVYSSNKGVDPGEELFNIEDVGRMHLALYERSGELIWDKELPKGVLSGIWWVPVVPFDMDQDGEDEIYFVNNTGAPFSFMHRKLERLNAATGEVTGSWPWPWNTFEERMSLCYRFYIVAGYAHGEPVLVTCQGTYGNMYLQGWNNDHQPRWELVIRADDPGPRASHVTPVIDINGDGVDELLWGERVISLDDGRELFDYAPDYTGHSDVIIPFLDYKKNEWYLFTCREGDDERPEGNDRVVTFKAGGEKAWADLKKGHMHTAWVANVLDGHGKIVMAMREHFVPDDVGFNHEIDGCFYYDAYTGEKVDFSLPCKGYECVPVDLDGDGYHEFYVHRGELAGTVLDRFGKEIGKLSGWPVRIGKIAEASGEQIMLTNGDEVMLWGDKDAVESPLFKRRYETPYLTFMQKLMATGYNAEGSQVACGV